MKTFFATFFLLFTCLSVKAQITQITYTATIGGKVIITPTTGTDTLHSLISIGNYAVLHTVNDTITDTINWVGYLSPEVATIVSITPKVKMGKIVLYPNPGNHDFKIQFLSSELEKVKEALITDVSGKTVSKVQLTKSAFNEWSFDADLPKGTYFLNLGNSIKSERFIVE